MVASRYDEDRTVEEIWGVEQEFVARWVETLPRGTRILDVPAGTGRFLEMFQRRGFTVHALDVSADMVAEIHRRYPELAKSARVAVGDAEHLDLPDDAVDCVISWRFFHLIPAPVADRVLREFHRVCRGKVLVQVFGVQPGLWGRLVAGLRRRLRRAAPVAAGPATNAAAASPWAHIQNFSHREPELRARFKRAGFMVERAVTVATQHGLPSRAYFLRRVGAAGQA